MARPNVFALTIAGALAASACLGTVRLEQSLPATIGDLAAIKAMEVTGEDGVVLLRGTFTDVASANGKITRTVTLTSPSGKGPTGSAEIQISRANGVSDEEVTLKVRDMPYPAVCRLMADGKEIAMFSTSEQGKADLRLNRRVTAGAAVN